MNLGSLIITVALAQNVILVHFLGPWPYPSLVSSTRQAAIYSGGITAALVWTAVLYGVVYKVLLQPFGLYFLETFALVMILSGSYLLWMAVITRVFPHLIQQIRRIMPIVFLNATVFVVPMALAAEVRNVLFIPIAAAAAGVGILVVLVPIAAINERLRDSRLPRILSGNAIILFITALFAFAVQQLDMLLVAVSYRLW